MTQSRLMGAAVALAIAAISLGGCERTRERAVVTTQSTTTPRAAPTAIGGGPLDTRTAVEHIVRARCVREAACGFIDEHAKWASQDACLEVVSREYADDLTEADCPNAIDGKKLSVCIEAARSADCTQAIDVIGRVPACRTSRMCSTPFGGHFTP